MEKKRDILLGCSVLAFFPAAISFVASLCIIAPSLLEVSSCSSSIEPEASLLMFTLWTIPIYIGLLLMDILFSIILILLFIINRNKIDLFIKRLLIASILAIGIAIAMLIFALFAIMLDYMCVFDISYQIQEILGLV